jgi:hypothetical protein
VLSFSGDPVWWPDGFVVWAFNIGESKKFLKNKPGT